MLVLVQAKSVPMVSVLVRLALACVLESVPIWLHLLPIVEHATKTVQQELFVLLQFVCAPGTKLFALERAPRWRSTPKTVEAVERHAPQVRPVYLVLVRVQLE